MDAAAPVDAPGADARGCQEVGPSALQLRAVADQEPADKPDRVHWTEQCVAPAAAPASDAPSSTWRTAHKDESGFHTFVRLYYMPFMVRFHTWVLAAWFVVFIISVITGPAFLKATRSNLDLPKGTPSEAAVNEFKAQYPSVSAWPSAFLVQHTTTLDSVLGAHTELVSTRLATFAAEHPSVISFVSGYHELIANPALRLLAEEALAPNNRTLVTTIGFRASTTLTDIQETVTKLLKWESSVSTPDVSVRASGLFPLFNQMSHATEENFALIDAVVLPIAILILGFRVRSYRHMGIAFACLGCGLLLAFALLVPVAAEVDINPFAPSVMLSLGIAILFDYALFMITRFREERLESFRSKEDAVFECLGAAGHVVVLSGSTLFTTFVLLLAFPQNFLQSVGYGCGMVVLTSILVSMTLTPALLLYFDCLSHFDLLPSKTYCCCRTRLGDPATASRALAAAEEARAATKPAASGRRGLWFEIAWAASAPTTKWMVLAIFAAITAPFAISYLKMTPTSDDYIIYLQGSSTLEALKVMKEAFSEGTLDQYQLIVVSNAGPGAALSPDYFAAENAIVHSILSTQTGYVDSSSVTALSFFKGADVSWITGMSYFDPSSALFNSSIAGAYRILVGSKLNGDKSTSLVTMTTLISPNSQAIVGFINGVRGLIASYVSPSSVKPTMHLFGGYTTTMDVQDSLYKLVPAEIGAVVAIVLLIVGLSFGSVGLALRLAVTIFVSLVWTYGLMVLVYQPGPAQDAFAKITPSILASSGLYWIIPIMSFSILTGLALDYDIFLMQRVVEFRQRGWSDRASVALGVEKSGGIITAAGLIMAVSFAGLLVPPTVVLNQYGFALFIGVVLDTFLVRSLLVPVVVSILGDVPGRRANWWPRQMPVPLLSPAEEERCLRAGTWEPQLEWTERPALPVGEGKAAEGIVASRVAPSP